MKRTRSMIINHTVESNELDLYGCNNEKVYRFLMAITENLDKHCKRGNYDHDRAVDSFYRAATMASDLYNKEFGYSFDVTARFTVAECWAMNYEDDKMMEVC